MENFKKITREQLKKWIDEKKDFVLIDVLAQGSYEMRHLPGAKHASVKDDDFLKKVSLFTSKKDESVVVYCASFTCQLSPLAASRLSDAGYINVYDFEGGIADWQDAGYPFEKGLAQEKAESGCGCCN